MLLFTDQGTDIALAVRHEALYRCLAAAHEIFNLLGIEYWLDAGGALLLGDISHPALISPWTLYSYIASPAPRPLPVAVASTLTQHACYTHRLSCAEVIVLLHALPAYFIHPPRLLRRGRCPACTLILSSAGTLLGAVRDKVFCMLFGCSLVSDWPSCLQLPERKCLTTILSSSATNPYH